MNSYRKESDGKTYQASGCSLPRLFVGGGLIAGVASGESAPFWLAGGFGTILTAIILVTSIPNFLAGYGLLKMYSWGRILGIILSVINLPGFPIGTALGIYGLIVLLHGESTLIFDRKTAPLAQTIKHL